MRKTKIIRPTALAEWLAPANPTRLGPCVHHGHDTKRTVASWQCELKILMTNPECFCMTHKSSRLPRT